MSNEPMVSASGLNLICLCNAFLAAAHAACWAIVDWEKGNSYWEKKVVTKVGDAHVLEVVLPQLTEIAHQVEVLMKRQANSSSFDHATLIRLVADLTAAQNSYRHLGGVKESKRAMRSINEIIDQCGFPDPDILLSNALACLERSARSRDN